MSLKSYALSVTAVIIIATISDMLLQNGRMKKISRLVFSVISTLVFISPILQLVKSEAQINDLITVNEYEIDESFIVYCLEVRKEMVENDVQSLLKSMNIDKAKVTCIIEKKQDKYEVKNILINLEQSVIIGENKHINNIEIANRITSELKLERGRVTVVG